MSVIRIKRAAIGGSAVPTTLEYAEPAYSFASDKLFIGDVNNDPVVIGGKYFTDKLDHTAGTLTANSAIIVDDAGKIDNINVGNLSINGSTNKIVSTNANGAIIFDTAGEGIVRVISGISKATGNSAISVFEVVDPTSTSLFSVRQNGDAVIGGVLTVSGTGTSTFNGDVNIGGALEVVNGATVNATLQGTSLTLTGDLVVEGNTTFGNATTDTITYVGRVNSDILPSANNTYDLGSGVLTWNDGFFGGNVAAGQVTVDNLTINNNTIVSNNGSIGFGGAILSNLANPVANTDAVTLGYLNTQFTSALNITDGIASDVVSLLTDTLVFVGGTGLTSAVTNNTVTLNLDNTTVAFGSYGSATGVGTFTVDAQGRLTSASTTAISIPNTQINNWDEAVQDTVGAMVDLNTENGIGVTYDDATGKLNFDVADFTITLGGDLSGSATITNLGNATLTATIQPNSVALGTDTTGNYIATGAVSGNGLSGSAASEGATFTVTSNATNLNTPSTIVFRDASGNFTAGTITAALSGNATTATTLQTARTISLSGDVSGSVSFNGSQNVDIVTTIQPNSIALGTDTTGNYVASLVAGTGVSLLNNTGEGATPTISIGQDVSTTANVVFQNGEFTGNIIIGGNVTVGGNVVTISATTLSISDNMIYLNEGSVNTNPDIGIAGNYNNGTYAHTGFFRDATDGVWKVYDGYALEPDANIYIDTTHASFHLADIQAGKFIGNLQGNANTATKLETARTFSIAGDVVATAVSFDGSGNVVLNATIQPNSVALGTDTTGDYVATLGVTAGTGISISGNSGESAAVTIAGIDAGYSTKGVASFNSTNFTVTSGAVSINTVDGGTF